MNVELGRMVAVLHIHPVSFDLANLIVSAVLFYAAAEISSDERLATEFGGIADRFLERGLQGSQQLRV